MLLALVVGLANAAAGTAGATPRSFEGALTFHIGSMPPIAATATGVVDLAGTSLLPSLGLAQGLFAATASVRVTDPIAAPIEGVYAQFANDAGVLGKASAGANFRGVMPIQGVTKVCLFDGCDQAPLANVSVPLSVVGDTTRAVVGSGVVNVTVEGAPWTTGTAMYPPATPTSGQFRHRGALAPGDGTIVGNAVTPIFIRTNIPAIAVIHGWASLDFTAGDGCADGIDNDGDGRVDLGDPGCSSAADLSERGAATACDDGADQDYDGKIDFPNDPGCSGPDDPDELQTLPVLPCGNAADDDGDGKVDLQDPGCTGLGDPSEADVVECANGIDDDHDGATDFPADYGCLDANDATETTLCENGVDDDRDGLVDYPADPGCLGPWDPGEREFVQCDDGKDNDGDGLRDLEDPGCSSPLDDYEVDDTLVPGCRDGIDNDLDKLVDYPADPGCASADDPGERSPDLPCDDAKDNDGDGRRDDDL